MMRDYASRYLSPLFGLFFLSHLMFPGFLLGGQSYAQSSSEMTTGMGSEGEQLEAEVKDEAEAAKGQTFYKWIDEKGNPYFTNDPAGVPQRFRDNLEIIELLPLQVEGFATEETPASPSGESPPEPVVRDIQIEPERRDTASEELVPYKEVPFDRFIRIQAGMDEAEVLGRLGFPSLVTPNDYFHDGYHGKYRGRIIRLIYLGNRDLNQKTTVIEIQDGRVVNIERIFPF